MRRPLWVLGAMGACRPTFDLSDVPVLGGTPEVHERVRAEIAAFEAAIGPGRVQLKEVRIVHAIEGNALGQYSVRDQSIQVRVTELLTVTVRHELCHALDYAEDLMVEANPLFDELAAGMFSRAHMENVIPERYRTAQDQRQEAFADLCEVGPMAVNALLRPCDTQSPLAEEAARWLKEHVYRAYDEPPPLELDPSTVITKEGWAESAPVIAAGPEPGTVVIGEEEGQPGQLWDLYTGAWLDAPPVEPVPDVKEGPPARGLWVWDAAGYADGPAAAAGYVLLNVLMAGEAKRLFVFDPTYEGWREVVPACTLGGSELFTADGQVWRSWVEEDVLVRWMPLLP